MDVVKLITNSPIALSIFIITFGRNKPQNRNLHAQISLYRKRNCGNFQKSKMAATRHLEKFSHQKRNLAWSFNDQNQNQFICTYF